MGDVPQVDAVHCCAGRNKHIFPASRWEQFDAATVYETYTIHGSEIN